MKSVIRFSMMLIALCAIISACAKNNPDKDLAKQIRNHARSDVNQFILDKFKDHRIIMLADNDHHADIYMSSVISFLKYWLEAVKSGKRELSNLVYVVEADSMYMKQIHKYMVSHDIRDLIGSRQTFNTQLLSTATLDYYWQLGNISKLADQLGAGDTNKILGFLGPEMPIDLDNWSIIKRDSFFIHKRDIISSDAIISYLKANPDRKALIFYGSAHLSKFEELKDSGTVKAKGLYLAHYLEKEFGNQLYLIDQSPIWRFEAYLKDRPFDDSSFVIEKQYIDSPQLKSCDAVIAINKLSGPRVSLQYVKSKNLGWLVLDLLKADHSGINNFYATQNTAASQYLSVLTGQMTCMGGIYDSIATATHLSSWDAWLNNPGNDVVSDIIAVTPAKRLLELIRNTSDRLVLGYSAPLFILNSGWKSHYWFDYFSVLQDGNDKDYNKLIDQKKLLIETFSKHLEENKNRIVVTDLVQLLWVGTDKEKNEAIKILQEKTGQNLTTPPEWMDWWNLHYGDL